MPTEPPASPLHQGVAACADLGNGGARRAEAEGEHLRHAAGRGHLPAPSGAALRAACGRLSRSARFPAARQHLPPPAGRGGERPVRAKFQMVRYADDLVILCPTGQGAGVKERLARWLHAKGLALKQKTRAGAEPPGGVLLPGVHLPLAAVEETDAARPRTCSPSNTGSTRCRRHGHETALFETGTRKAGCGKTACPV